MSHSLGSTSSCARGRGDSPAFRGRSSRSCGTAGGNHAGGRGAGAGRTSGTAHLPGVGIQSRARADAQCREAACLDACARSGRRRLRRRVPSPPGTRMGLHDRGAHGCEKATVGLPSGPPATGDSPMSQSVAWHGDTYAAGPPLEEFRRALNLQGATGQSAGGTPGVYVVSDYMAAPGHRGQLRQVLDKNRGGYARAEHHAHPCAGCAVDVPRHHTL